PPPSPYRRAAPARFRPCRARPRAPATQVRAYFRRARWAAGDVVGLEGIVHAARERPPRRGGVRLAPPPPMPLHLRRHEPHRWRPPPRAAHASTGREPAAGHAVRHPSPACGVLPRAAPARRPVGAPPLAPAA